MSIIIIKANCFVSSKQKKGERERVLPQFSQLSALTSYMMDGHDVPHLFVFQSPFRQQPSCDHAGECSKVDVSSKFWKKIPGGIQWYLAEIFTKKPTSNWYGKFPCMLNGYI